MSDAECTCKEVQSKSPSWSGANCRVIVTGASRGFGREFCYQLLKALIKDKAASIAFLLMGRDGQALKDVETKMLALASDSCHQQFRVQSNYPTIDMATTTEVDLKQALESFLSPDSTVSTGNNWNLLVNNAAILGNIKLRADERHSMLSELDYLRLNVVAPMILTNCFLQLVPSSPSSKTVVVNVSSKAAIVPFPCMTSYCVGKAAREMTTKCLASDCPHVAVFNYSPGPLATDMFNQLTEELGNPQLRSTMTKIANSSSIIQPSQSAYRCVYWLTRFQWNDSDDANHTPYCLACLQHEPALIDICSGSRLDYHDAAPPANIKDTVG